MFKLHLRKKNNKSKKENKSKILAGRGFFGQGGFLLEKRKVIAGFQAGFTLIEMVIVIAMIGIITGATLKLVKFSDIYKNLTLKTAEIKGMLRNAQILALAPPVIEKNGDKLLICGFGLRSQNTSSSSGVSVFYSYSVNGEVDDCADIGNISSVCNRANNNSCENYETRHFEGFNVSDKNASNVKVFFRSPYGDTVGVSDTGYSIVVKQTENNYTKTIKVNKFGKINEE